MHMYLLSFNSTCTCKEIHISLYIHICVHVYRHIYVRTNLCTYVCVYIYIMYVYSCLYIYTSTYVCMYVCMHACMHVCMYVCVYIYIYSLPTQEYKLGHGPITGLGGGEGSGIPFCVSYPAASAVFRNIHQVYPSWSVSCSRCPSPGCRF